MESFEVQSRPRRSNVPMLGESEGMLSSEIDDDHNGHIVIDGNDQQTGIGDASDERAKHMWWVKLVVGAVAISALVIAAVAAASYAKERASSFRPSDDGIHKSTGGRGQ